MWPEQSALESAALPPSGSLMLDASLLLAQGSARAVRRAFDDADLPAVFVPHTLWVLLSEGQSLEPLAELYAPFGNPSNASRPEDLAFVVERNEFKPFAAPSEQGDAGERFGVMLDMTRGNEILAAVLTEELFFLHSHSWIASRTKRTFTTFKRAGDSVFEFGRESLDKVVGRTLKLPGVEVPGAIAASQRLRAATKWVAVGGPPVAALINPMLGMVAGAAGGFFLLFDP
jgi:hypothetical protein